MSVILEFINVSKNFTQANQVIEVLKSISFNLKLGEFVALTGQSGSGKTTLLQLAGLLDIPNSGEIVINDINVYNKLILLKSIF